jgi:hypothetical protein
VERWPPNRDVADLDQVVGDGDLVGDLLAVERLVAGLRPLLADDHELPGDLHVFDGVVVAGRVGEAEVHRDLAVTGGQVLGLGRLIDVDEQRPPLNQGPPGAREAVEPGGEDPVPLGVEGVHPVGAWDLVHVGLVPHFRPGLLAAGDLDHGGRGRVLGVADVVVGGDDHLLADLDAVVGQGVPEDLYGDAGHWSQLGSAVIAWRGPAPRRNTN